MSVARRVSKRLTKKAASSELLPSQASARSTFGRNVLVPHRKADAYEFTPIEKYNEIEKAYATNHHRGKTVFVDRTRIEEIMDILEDPMALKNYDNSDVTYVHRTFYLLKTPTRRQVLDRSKHRMVIPRESIYDILCDGHINGNGKHIGRQKTYLAVSKFCGIPRPLAFSFVDACPACGTKRSRQQRQASDTQPRASSSGSSTRIDEHGFPEPKTYKDLVKLLFERISISIPDRSSTAEGNKLLEDFRRIVKSLSAEDEVYSLIACQKGFPLLKKLWSDLGSHDEPSLRQALENDEVEIAHMLRRVLNSKSKETVIFSLRPAESRRFAELIHSISFGDDDVFRRKAQKLLLALPSAGTLMPSSWTIKGVKLLAKNAVAFGGFADIYKGSYNGCTVALKCLRPNNYFTSEDQDKVRSKLRREALVWKDLKHPHILPFLGIDAETFPTSFACLVAPWMSRGTILTYLLENELPTTEVDRLIFETAQGLAYLHTRDVIHGDLHCSNILLDQNLHIRLADFGLAKIANNTNFSTSSNNGGVYRYMAPELVAPLLLAAPTEENKTNSRKSPASDVFAFGMICWQIYVGEKPFAETKADYAIAKLVWDGERPSRPVHGRIMSDSLWGLLNNCWRQNLSDRPNMINVLERMKDFDFGTL